MAAALDPGRELRAARARAGLTQSRLAQLAGTSQATVASYESGRKQPSLTTLSRLLAVTGTRVRTSSPPVTATPDQLARSATILVDVLALADELPFARLGPLRYPRLPSPAR